jgi:protein-disulfide isomerase
MQFRKKHLFPILLILALALVLGACQNAAPPAGGEAAPTEAAQEATAAPSPEATAAPAEATAEPDTGFQDVDVPLDKLVFPAEAPAGFSPAERPDSTLGQDDAQLTMYEWCDYAYPNCVTFNTEILPELQKKYIDTGKLRIVHKEFPVAGGDPSVVAAMGAQCAAEQDNYQAMADWLYANTGAWTQQTDVQAMKDAVKKGAGEAGLDTDAFNACLDNEETLDVVKEDYFDGSDLEIKELPAFVVDGHVINEGMGVNDLSTIIDALLQRKETGELPDTVVTVTPSPTPDTDFEEETVSAKGSPDAPVTIVEFSDFQCPFCEKFFTETLPQIQEEYIDTGKVKLVFKDFPLSFHGQAMPAAMTAECAGEQGKYWEMHDKLFGEQSRWVDKPEVNDVMKQFADELGLDTDQFNQCFDSNKYADEINADMQEGIAAGVQGTPAFFINGQFISGAQPFEVFKQIIDQMLAEKQ